MIEKGKITMSQNHSVDVLPLPPPPPPSAGKRNMKVIALAVVCIVLAASLVGVLAIYQPTSLQAQIKDKNNEINDKTNEIAALQTQVENLTSQLSSADSDKTTLQTQVTSLNTELTNLTSQLNSALTIMTMQASETLLSSTAVTIASVSNYTSVFDHSLPYPGYVVVQATSNSTTTFVQTVYSVNGVNYNQNITVGKSGSAAFPVLPTTVQIRVWATDTTAVNATATITYYY